MLKSVFAVLLVFGLFFSNSAFADHHEEEMAESSEEMADQEAAMGHEDSDEMEKPHHNEKHRAEKNSKKKEKAHKKGHKKSKAKGKAKGHEM